MNSFTSFSQSNNDDIIIVDNILNGDLDDFESIFRKYHKLIFLLSKRMLNDFDEAEEATQEIFLSIFKSLSTYKKEYKFFTWLYSIAINYLKKFTAKKYSEENSVKDYIETEKLKKWELIDDPEISFLNKEFMAEMKKIIFKLPYKYRELIYLHFYENMNYKRISQYLKIPVGTIKYRMFKAKEMLSKILITYDIFSHYTNFIN